MTAYDTFWSEPRIAFHTKNKVDRRGHIEIIINTFKDKLKQNEEKTRIYHANKKTELKQQETRIVQI